jgi:uncharacterized Zn finger protein
VGAKMPRITYSPFMEKWVAMLQVGVYPNDFTRGRTIGNTNKMQRLRVRPGQVSAEVLSSGYMYNHETRAVKVEVSTFSDAAWSYIGGRLAQERALVAQLLAGALPDALVQLCSDAGVRLLPLKDELKTSCEYDGRYFCKHTIGVCYRLGLMIDADPFVLLTLRGRSRAQLLAPLGLEADEPPAAPLPGDLPTFWQLDKPWPELQITITPFADDALPLAALGNPPAWHNGNLSDALLPLYQHIRDLAATTLDPLHDAEYEGDEDEDKDEDDTGPLYLDDAGWRNLRVDEQIAAMQKIFDNLNKQR